MTDSNETVLRVHYRRQIQPKEYETAEFSCDVEHSFPSGMSPEEIEKSAKRMAQEVKVVVLDQLGLDYTQDEETRIIMEAFPGSEKVARTTAPVSQSTEPAPAPVEPLRSVPTDRPTTARRRAPAPSGDDDTAALWEDVAKNPGNWFDNTENKQNPKAPDFRATNKSGFKSADGRFPAGLWLNTKPEDLVLPDEGYAG